LFFFTLKKGPGTPYRRVPSQKALQLSNYRNSLSS